MSVHEQSSTTTSYLAADEFWELPEVEGKSLELVEGRVVEMPTSGARHNEIALFITMLIYQFVREHGLGWTGGDATGYVIDGERESVLIPDASFVARQRIPPGGTPEGFWPFAPDLAVEVMSPHDRAIDVHNKVWRYLEGGTRLVWLVFPDRQQVQIFDHRGLVAELTADAQLDGGDVLPGFRVPVADIFESSVQVEPSEDEE